MIIGHLRKECSRTPEGHGKEGAMAITESELFKGVSQRFITRIANASEEEEYKANSIIFISNLPVSFLWVGIISIRKERF